ncbi:acyltransferase [Nitrospirillum sp. BR 11752]|uniref:acyltransferase family protein n=1 Tax=Nitrospirillum sp. BR 11752 TaxID=3104293 RepID=UPI002EB28CCC|nr:acyltransferase [Nitrospirillum sp. BR 11752]
MPKWKAILSGLFGAPGTPTKVDTLLDRDRNNLDVVRLFAALGVIFGHSYALFSNAAGYREPFAALTKFDNLGGLSVTLFFFISGFLIPASFVNSKSPFRYALMRVARLWPAATACMAVAAFVIGPWVSTLSRADYFASPMPWGYFRDGIRLYLTPIYLPGVFEHNQYPRVVNGSIWSLPLELTCYCYVFVLGLVGAFSSRARTNLLCLILIVIHFTFPQKLFYFVTDDDSTIRLAAAFLTGTFFYANRKVIPVDWRALPILFAAWWMSRATPLSMYLFYLFWFYAAVVAACSRSIKAAVRLPGDYSYGVYLYGFLTQQTLNHFYPKLPVFTGMLLSMAMALLLGGLSYHLLEHPVMGGLVGWFVWEPVGMNEAHRCWTLWDLSPRRGP